MAEPCLPAQAPETATVIMGQNYTFTAQATDSDAGDQANLTYSLGLRPDPDVMTIDKTTGVVTTNWPTSVFKHFQSGPFTFTYTVSVNDGRGGYTTQDISVTAECPAGSSWVWNNGQGDCVPFSQGIEIISSPTQTAIHTTDLYSYQVTAIDEVVGAPLTYALSGAPFVMSGPGGMSIDATGLITWQTAADTPTGPYSFQVLVTDNVGNGASQLITVGVCKAPQKWYGGDMNMCMN
jgi:hypothetical protein